MIAKVLVLINNKHVDRFFDYEVTNQSVEVGNIVLVDFNNRKIKGFVFKITNEKSEYKLKPILEVYNNYKLDHEEIRLIKFLHERYGYCYSLIIEFILNNSIINSPKKEEFERFCYLNENYTKIKSEKFIRFLCDININNSYEYLKSIGYDSSYLNNLYKKDIISFKNIKKDILKEYINERIDLNNDLKEINNYSFSIIDINKQIQKIIDICEYSISRNENTFIITNINYYADLIENKIKSSGIKVLNLSKYSKDKYVNILNDIKDYPKKGLVVIGLKDTCLTNLSAYNHIIIHNINSDTYLKSDISKYNLLDVIEYKINSKLNNSSYYFIDSSQNLRLSINDKIKYVKSNNEVKSNYTLVDLKDEFINHNNISIISTKLKNKIKECINNNQKVLILVNNLGYSDYVICRECGHVIKCKECDISLSYSKERKELSCKYCGHHEDFNEICPKCGSHFIRYVGLGIEKVVDYFNEEFNEVNYYTKGNIYECGSLIDISTSYYLNLNNISKYNLICVLDSDYLFQLSNYNQFEKGYYYFNKLLSIINTYNIENFIIQGYNFNSVLLYALNNKYEDFFKQEIENRLLGKYFPYYNLLSCSINHDDYKMMKSKAYYLYNILKNNDNFIILKPTYNKINKNFEILIKYKSDYQITILLKYINDFEKKNKVEIYYDVKN